MKITDHKVLIEFSPAKVQFFRIDPEDISVTLKSILRVLMDLSWLSKFDQDFEQKAFESRATKTIEDIKAKFDQCVDDGITKDAGEYVVSELARETMISKLDYLDIPLAELVGKKRSGNPGFDFHSQNKTTDTVIFGEAKYVTATTAYSSALPQIVDFIGDEKDVEDQKKNILSSKSRLDITDDKMDEKYEEYKEAIKTGEFSDEYNLTNKDLEKLKSDSVTTVVPTLLDMMFTGADFVLPNAVAKEVYEDFQCLYKQYLGRELTAAEKYVFDSAIKIMIWKVHGKTFSKICQERYAYVSNVAQRRFLAKAGQQNRADNLPVRYIAGYSDIPDKELRAYPLFPVGTKGKDVDYDRIVYDTYDFLDKLIGFKLSDLFYAIFHQYYLAYQDNRAERLAKYIKYGTEDSTEIWMLRYGFSFEEIEWLKPCVESIDQTEIRFNGEIESLDDFQRSSIAQYLF